ncbi:GerMN domain-containing protein [Ktedonospora formicarum]|uniref:GerMN domain-containing protein n=1 Tax=Ktedonospora formicarum TaxID=2778364 RepID=A0A8J3HXU8_9CHLR|nr:GerMN domain-containing protein [Ktedonospora formicarum]GHO43966.1 hypothetical protein KSX_21290 [Ktedonospora formicarum]
MINKSQRRNDAIDKHLPSFRKGIFLTLTSLCVLLMMLTACNDSGTSQNNTPNNGSVTTTTNNSSTSATATPTSSDSSSDNASDQNNKGTGTASTPGAQVYHIKVFFSRKGETSFSSVHPLDRTTNSQAVATAAIQYLITGPTASEQQQGYYSELGSMLQGSASCPGGSKADFVIHLNTKGTTAEQGTATLQFCRDTSSAGIGMDARVRAQIEATLKQFSTIRKVVILTKNGSCFGDESGANTCLK